MDDDDLFGRYRARLRKPTWNPRLWGKRLSLHDWTYYEAAELRAKGTLTWRFKRWAGTDDPDLEIEGERGEGVWEAVSPWLIERRRRASEVARSLAELMQTGPAGPGEALVALGEDMRQVRDACAHKPGKGEAAFHVVEHRRRAKDEVAIILALAGYKGVFGETVDDDVRNGKRRKGGCRFCELSKLPP